ncbi:hypothetical protein GQ457_02G025900 [Hibiscus cannabinus]
MYAMICTRPDLTYALSMTSRYQANPDKGHWTAVKNILKYLRRTKDVFLFYGGKEELGIKGYTDASFQTNKDDSRSQSGFIFYLNGGAVSWKSSKQDKVVDSTTDAEYLAASEAAKEAVWIKNEKGRNIELKEVQQQQVIEPEVEEISQAVEENPTDLVTQPLRRSTRERHEPERYGFLITTHGGVILVDQDEPKTYQEAVASPDSEKWLEAMRSEMDSMSENQVCTMVEPPEGIKPVGCKWVFKKKTDMDGNVQTYKGRLVAKGFRQIHGVDYGWQYQEERLIATLRQHKEALGWTITDIKGISPTICMHKILLDDNHKPTVDAQHRLNQAMKDVVRKEILKWLDAGIIYPISDSEWVSPVQCVPKKGGITVISNEKNELIPTRTVTGWRVCMDYRKLNKATLKDHFPLPFIDQMLDRLAGKQFYCFLDGYSGYNQIAIAPEDQSKTTFTCPYGTFAFRRMPFGLCNAPAMFQRCMTAIFSDLNEDCLEIFMDDFSTFGEDFDNCLSNLENVLKRCKETNLVLNWEKCHFMVDEGIVLGHKISSKGMEVDKAKIEVISKLPPPTTVKGIRSFFGHAGFYRRFIEDFSKITKPLCSLLEQGRPFEFNNDCAKTFNLLKQKLVTAPIVEPPDWKLPFELMCDASDYAVGAVIGQKKGKIFHPIYYASKTLNDA